MARSHRPLDAPRPAGSWFRCGGSEDAAGAGERAGEVAEREGGEHRDGGEEGELRERGEGQEAGSVPSSRRLRRSAESTAAIGGDAPESIYGASGGGGVSR